MHAPTRRRVRFFFIHTHACAFYLRLCISNSRRFSNRLHRKKGGLLVFMFCIIVPSILVLCGGVCFGHKIYYSSCQEGIFVFHSLFPSSSLFLANTFRVCCTLLALCSIQHNLLLVSKYWILVGVNPCGRWGPRPECTESQS